MQRSFHYYPRYRPTVVFSATAIQGYYAVVLKTMILCSITMTSTVPVLSLFIDSSYEYYLVYLQKFSHYLLVAMTWEESLYLDQNIVSGLRDCAVFYSKDLNLTAIERHERFTESPGYHCMGYIVSENYFLQYI